MIDRDRFVAEGRPRWEALDRLAERGPETAAEWSELAALYRGLAADLSRARTHGLSADVQSYLDGLAGRSHNALYGSSHRRTEWAPLQFLLEEVPREIRNSRRWMWLSGALLWVPFLVYGALSWHSDGWATALIPEATLAEMEAAYSEAPDDRSEGQAAMMAGFYVQNNISIALRCFSTGALFGIGSVYTLIWNGLFLGAVCGHVARLGGVGNLGLFVSGHIAWEMLGIVVAGAGGLRLGWSLVETQGRTRWASARAEAHGLVRLVSGAAFMILVAAGIEGFWSASPMPAPIKFVFGAVQVGVIAAWWSWGGGRRP